MLFCLGFNTMFNKGVTYLLILTLEAKLTKKRSRRYRAKTITDADYADDITL